jgi:hypothetical protein
MYRSRGSRRTTPTCYTAMETGFRPACGIVFADYGMDPTGKAMQTKVFNFEEANKLLKEVNRKASDNETISALDRIADFPLGARLNLRTLPGGHSVLR